MRLECAVDKGQIMTLGLDRPLQWLRSWFRLWGSLGALYYLVDVPEIACSYRLNGSSYRHHCDGIQTWTFTNETWESGSPFVHELAFVAVLFVFSLLSSLC